MRGKKLQIRNSTTDFLVFAKQSGEDGIEVRVYNESVWLTQKGMAQLFDCSVDNIGLHLKNIVASGELSESATTEKFSVVQFKIIKNKHKRKMENNKCTYTY